MPAPILDSSQQLGHIADQLTRLANAATRPSTPPRVVSLISAGFGATFGGAIGVISSRLAEAHARKKLRSMIYAHLGRAWFELTMFTPDSVVSWPDEDLNHLSNFPAEQVGIFDKIAQGNQNGCYELWEIQKIQEFYDVLRRGTIEDAETGRSKTKAMNAAELRTVLTDAAVVLWRAKLSRSINTGMLEHHRRQAGDLGDAFNKTVLESQADIGRANIERFERAQREREKLAADLLRQLSEGSRG
jgi:hypothetical protein